MKKVFQKVSNFFALWLPYIKLFWQRNVNYDTLNAIVCCWCCYGFLHIWFLRWFVLVRWLTLYWFQVLSIVQPPYSGDFTTAFLPLLHNEEITGPLRSSNQEDAVSLFLGTAPLNLLISASVQDDAIFWFHTLVADCPRRAKKKKKSRSYVGTER